MSYGTEFCFVSRGHQNFTAKVQMLGVETRDAHSKIVQVEVIKSWKRLPGRRNGVVKLELDFGQNEQDEILPKRFRKGNGRHLKRSNRQCQWTRANTESGTDPHSRGKARQEPCVQKPAGTRGR
jgi:hypothetical protein